jgi:D-glycero-alpha-D-manno-heptose 1-phosphate guanylyltransferase
MTKLLVLAVGFGTRLRAVVEDVPKPLAPVAGLSLIYWINTVCDEPISC